MPGMGQPEDAIDPLERAIDVFNQLSEGLSDEDGKVSDLPPADIIAYVQAAAQIALVQRLDLLRHAIVRSAATLSKDSNPADKADQSSRAAISSSDQM